MKPRAVHGVDQQRAPEVPSAIVAELREQPLQLLETAARLCGPVALLPSGAKTFALVTGPAGVKQILTTSYESFEKRIEHQPGTQRLFGRGLLTSEGARWRDQRRIIQPAFHLERISQYADAMVELADQHISRWRPGTEIDVAEEMKRITMRIAVRTLFAFDDEFAPSQVADSIDTVIREDLERARGGAESTADVSGSAEDALSSFDRTVTRIIDATATQDRVDGSLLEALRHRMPDMKQVRDEVATMLVAGYETTALAMAWALSELMRNQRSQDRLHTEVQRSLGQRLPGYTTATQLPYLQAVVAETLRLYPPVYAFGRTAIHDVEISGYAFPADTNFLISPWVMHRNAELFPLPTKFAPERWMDGLEKRLPAYSYIPFGAGPRGCVGTRFARLEATLVLATIVQRFQLTSPSGKAPEVETLLTLRPRNGVQARITPRPAPSRRGDGALAKNMDPVASRRKSSIPRQEMSS